MYTIVAKTFENDLNRKYIKKKKKKDLVNIRPYNKVYRMSIDNDNKKS